MALEGTLNYLDIEHLLTVLGSSEKSGVLEIWSGEREARLYLQRGRLLRAESSQDHDGIGTLLVKAGVLHREDLDRALSLQKRQNESRRLGAILSDEFGVSPEDIQQQLRRQFEGIVFDVFRWPSGRFAFHFQEPEEVLDRFNLNPAQFILQIGIQTGLLAREGAERVQDSGSGRHLVFLLEDEGTLERFGEFKKGKGARVTCCRTLDELCPVLGDGGAPDAVVATDLFDTLSGEFGVLEEIASRWPGVPVVALGQSSSPGARKAALDHGAKSYVRKPAWENLDGPQGRTYLHLFMLSLDKALEAACPAAAGKEMRARA